MTERKDFPKKCMYVSGITENECTLNEEQLNALAFFEDSIGNKDHATFSTTTGSNLEVFQVGGIFHGAKTFFQRNTESKKVRFVAIFNSSLAKGILPQLKSGKWVNSRNVQTVLEKMGETRLLNQISKIDRNIQKLNEEYQDQLAEFEQEKLHIFT